MNNQWIECNLPWYASQGSPMYLSYPDMREKVKDQFGMDKDHWEEHFFPGYHTDGMKFLSDHPIFQEYEQVRAQFECEYFDSGEEKVKTKLAESTSEAVQTVLAYRAKMREINEWIDSQPEILAVEKANEIIRKKHKEVESELSFCGKGFNRAGTLIEFEEDGKLQQMMIGTINEVGGSCNDCRGISDDTIILRYKVLWNGQDS